MGKEVPQSFGHSLDEAREAVDHYARVTPSTWFSRAVVERETYWFFQVGFIGSCGVIVNKADLALFPLGSGLPTDDWFWGHEHGFSPKLVVLRVRAVRDLDPTIEFLLHLACAPPNRNPNPRRAWLRTALERLPYDCPPQNLWLAIRAFRSLEPPLPFDYHVLQSQGSLEPAPRP